MDRPGGIRRLRATRPWTHRTPASAGETGVRCVHGTVAQIPTSDSNAPSSMRALIVARYRDASAPSTSRWSYDNDR